MKRPVRTGVRAQEELLSDEERAHAFGRGRRELGRNERDALHDPVRPDDLAATLFYLLGIDPSTEVHALGNRPVLISEGKPVLDIIA